MQIYLVRHAETGGNVARRHQAKHTPLTTAGEKQATEIAETLKDYQPTHLLSSTMVRAVETASIIGNDLNLVPDLSDLFVELDRPEGLYGHHHKSAKSMMFYMRWYLSNNVPGESYQALRERFRLAQEFLSQYPDDARLAVVSHSVFINLFIAHLCRDKSLTPLQAAFAFKNILTMPNVSVTPLNYSQTLDEKICDWSVDR